MYPQGPQTGGENYYELPQKPKKQYSLAITSFVLSLLPIMLSVFCCCCATNSVAVNGFIICLLLMTFLAMFTGILSLISHRGGTGFAVSGITVSILMLFPLIFSLICVNTPYYKDMMKFTEHAQEYVDDYDRTGEVPEDFEKYKDPKYDDVWKSMGFDSFDGFYGDFIARYKAQNAWVLDPSASSSRSESSRAESSESRAETTTRPANYGETPITI